LSIEKRKYGKKNQVKVDPLAYNTGLIGESGVGKTTLIYEVCEKLVGDEGYIFLECGKEDGEEAIQDIVAEKVPDWDTFEEITDDIMDNKTTDYPNLKVVVADTFDQLVEIAKEEVILMHNRENPDKPIKSIKQAFGGFMSGEDMAVDMVLDRLWELKKVGVRFIAIGHTKKKDVEDVVTGQTYSILTTDMSNRDFNKLKNKLHFLGVASIDREIVQQKTGKKNIVTKKEETKGVVKSETRKITFRDDNYSIDSKSRFADIVESVPLSSDEFIKALTDAIKVEQSKSGKTFEQSQKEQEKDEAEKLKEIKKVEQEKHEKKEKEKLNEELTEMRNPIVEFIKDNKSDMKKIKPVLDLSKELGFANPTLIDNAEDIKKVLELIK